MIRSRPPTVLHVIPTDAPGGAELSLGRLLRASAQGGVVHGVQPLTHVNGFRSPYASAGFILPPTASTLREAFRPPALLRLRGQIRQVAPAIVQSWLYPADIAATLSLIGGPQSRRIWSIRTGDIWRRPGRPRAAPRLAALLCRLYPPDIIVSCSEEALKQHLRLGYPSDVPSVVVPNGVELPSPRQLPSSSPSSAPVILRVGRWHPVKGYDVLFRALAELKSRGMEFSLLLVGADVDPSNQELAREVEEAGLIDRVELLGYREDLSEVYGRSTVVISSSRAEGFPNVVAEAMAAGRPVVATDVGDTRTVVGEGGRVVPPDDPEAMADAISELLRDSELRDELGRLGRRRIADKFSLPAMVRNHEEIWRALLPQSGRGDS